MGISKVDRVLSFRMTLIPLLYVASGMITLNLRRQMRRKEISFTPAIVEA